MDSHANQQSFRNMILLGKYVASQSNYGIINGNYWFVVIFHPFICFSSPFSASFWSMFPCVHFLLQATCHSFFNLFVFTLLLCEVNTSTFSYMLTPVIEKTVYFYITKFHRNVLRVLKYLSSCYLSEHKLLLILTIRLKGNSCRDFSPCWKHQQKDIIYTVKVGVRDARQMQCDFFDP